MYVREEQLLPEIDAAMPVLSTGWRKYSQLIAGMAVRSQASHGAGPDGPRARARAAGINRRRGRGSGSPSSRAAADTEGADNRELVDEP
jgi:hypothetical protein